MIDDLVLLITTSVIIFVVIRAVQLDRMLPWFTVDQSPHDDQPRHPAPPWRSRRSPTGHQRLPPAGKIRRRRETGE
ncbi:MAG TPA: hypothetical protein VE690_11585 [Rhodopila sp.]|nr:hypothetical protein [Rhodopila sp.]